MTAWLITKYGDGSLDTFGNAVGVMNGTVDLSTATELCFYQYVYDPTSSGTMSMTTGIVGRIQYA
ncbi:hypothetical protein D3C76_1376820 [compost metagenome]